MNTERWDWNKESHLWTKKVHKAFDEIPEEGSLWLVKYLGESKKTAIWKKLVTV